MILPWQGSWTGSSAEVPFKPNNSVILWHGSDSWKIWQDMRKWKIFSSQGLLNCLEGVSDLANYRFAGVSGRTRSSAHAFLLPSLAAALLLLQSFLRRPQTFKCRRLFLYCGVMGCFRTTPELSAEVCGTFYFLCLKMSLLWSTQISSALPYQTSKPWNNGGHLWTITLYAKKLQHVTKKLLHTFPTKKKKNHPRVPKSVIFYL